MKKQIGTIDMTPTWAATLRIYGLAIQSGTPEGVRSGHEGLQEAANHLDNTLPKRCEELKQALKNLAYAVATAESVRDSDVVKFLQAAREMTGMANECPDCGTTEMHVELGTLYCDCCDYHT